MTWVAQYSTWLPIELMPKGVVFLFFSLYYVLKQLVAAVDVRQGFYARGPTRFLHTLLQCEASNLRDSVPRCEKRGMAYNVMCQTFLHACDTHWTCEC